MKFRFSLAMLCLVFGMILTAAEKPQDPPLKAAKGWYFAILKGDLAAADALSADDETKKSNVGDLKTLDEIRKKAPTDAKHRKILDGFERAILSEGGIDGDFATVKVVFPGYEDQEPGEIRLRKVDGRWLVTVKAKPVPEVRVSEAELAAAEDMARKWWQAVLNEDNKTADLYVVNPDNNASLIRYVHELKAKAADDEAARKELEDMRKAVFEKAVDLDGVIIVPAAKGGEPFFKILFRKENGKWLIVTIK